MQLVVEDMDDSRSTVSIKSRRSLSKTPSVKSSFTGKSSQVQDAPKNGSGKVTEAHFPSHATRLLAIASKAQVRYNMIFKNIHDATGPKRMEFAWEAIKDAAKRGSNWGIETALQRASTDVPLKKMLITFVSITVFRYPVLIWFSYNLRRLYMLEQTFSALSSLIPVAW